MAEIYAAAAGQLGWPDDVIMTTPIARLQLAIKGRSDFVSGILKAVFGKPPGEQEAAKLAEQKSDPQLAAQQLMAFVQSRQAHDARHRKKK